MAEEQTYSPYRWVILAAAWLFMVSLAWGIIMISPLSKQLMSDFNVAHGALAILFGAPTLIRIFVAIPGGILADRFGYKRMITTAGIIAGIFGILRGFSTTYFWFFAFAVIMGVGLAFVSPNITKLVRAWFPPHQIGTATGLYSTGFAVGMTIALATTYPLFGFNWQAASYVNGGIILLITFIWVFLGKERKGEPEKHSIIQNVSKALRHPDVWMVGLMSFLLIGGLWAFEAQFPVALENARSVNPTTAGTVSSMISIGLIVSNAFGPMLSDRIGLRRPFLILCPALAAVAIYLAWTLPFGTTTSVFSFMAGIFIGTAIPVALTIITEHKGVAAEILGTASGFVHMIAAIGTFFIPLLAGYISDWFPGYNATFIFISILVLLTVVCSLRVTETGPKAQVLAVEHNRT